MTDVKVNNFNNINKKDLLEIIAEECDIINSIDTSTEEGKNLIRRRNEELDNIVGEQFDDSIYEWLYP